MILFFAKIISKEKKVIDEATVDIRETEANMLDFL